MRSTPDVASRFRDDPVFRELARRDPRAALHSVGIAVPAGVTVDFLDNAFSAVDRLLDAAAPSSARALDDAFLEGVAGGTSATVATKAELNAFLEKLASVLDLTRAPRGD